MVKELHLRNSKEINDFLYYMIHHVEEGKGKDNISFEVSSYFLTTSGEQTLRLKRLVVLVSSLNRI